MPELAMIDAIRHALEQELAADERTIVFGQDVGQLGGVFRATDGLQERFGTDRVRDTPLAEGAIVGAAVGLAAAGMVPIAEIQFLGFSHHGFHQIVDQLARIRFRSRGQCPVQVTVRAPFGGGVKTPEIHSDAIEAQFAHVPGLKVIAPATAYDAKGLLLEAIRDPDPVLFCEPLRGYRLVKDDVPEHDYTVPIGEARVTRHGADVTVIAWSAGVQLCERAAVLAEEHGISCEVIDLRTLVPLDVETIVAAVEATGRAVVVQESPITGGFAGEVVATLQEEAFYSLEAPIERVGAPDAPYPPFVSIEHAYLPNEQRVLHAIRQVVERS